MSARRPLTRPELVEMERVVAEAIANLLVDGFTAPLRLEVRASNNVRATYEIGATGAVRRIASSIGDAGAVAPYEIRVTDVEGRHMRSMLEPVELAALN